MNKLSLTQQKEFLILKVAVESAEKERCIVANHHVTERLTKNLNAWAKIGDRPTKNKRACVDGQLSSLNQKGHLKRVGHGQYKLTQKGYNNFKTLCISISLQLQQIEHNCLVNIIDVIRNHQLRNCMLVESDVNKIMATLRKASQKGNV